MGRGIFMREIIERYNYDMPDNKFLGTAQARRAAERFKGLFPFDTFSRWEFCGDLRRGADSITECWHVAQPILDTSPLADPERRLLGQNAADNPLWRKLDLLVASGQAQYVYQRERGYLWHEHLRAVVYQGVPHHLISANARNWGVALVAATGPREFVRRLWERLEEKGYRVRPGLQLADANGGRVDVPTEDVLFDLAHVGPIKPEHRRPDVRFQQAGRLRP